VSVRLLVLGWHNVAGTYGFPSAPGGGERGFSQQMRALSRFGNVLALEEALQRLAAGERLPSRAVALTFDDGYSDNLTLAVPVLERLGLPATFFLVPGLLDGEIDAWWETVGWAIQTSLLRTLAWEGAIFALDTPSERQVAYDHVAKQLKLRDQAARQEAVSHLLDLLSPAGESPDLFMGWEGARELVSRGFAVQAHTCTHPVLSRETPERQRRELADARLRLQAELGGEVSTVAYPHGGPLDYSADTLAAAAAAGYRWGVTTREGFTTSDTSKLEIHRCVVYPERGMIDLLAQLRYLFQTRRSRRQSSVAS
jgi:peptidoglycan/xylan/chitin deacetylase (PgdA/CDA1 family)